MTHASEPCKKSPNLIDAPSQHSQALKSSKQYTQEESTARRASVAVVGALYRHCSVLEAQNSSLKTRAETHAERLFSPSQNHRKDARSFLLQHFPTDMLAISSKLYQGLAFCLRKEVRELRPNRDTLTHNRHSQSALSHRHATQTRFLPIGVLSPLLFFSSRDYHYTFSLVFGTSLLAAVSDAKLHHDHWLLTLSAQTSKQNFLSNLSNNPDLLRTIR